jgi:hypothetical protein
MLDLSMLKHAEYVCFLHPNREIARINTMDLRIFNVEGSICIACQ